MMIMMIMPRSPGSFLRRRRLCASALTSLSSGLGVTPLGTAGRKSPTSSIYVASVSTASVSSIHRYHHLRSDVSIFTAENTNIMRGERSEQRWFTTTRTTVSSSSSSLSSSDNNTENDSDTDINAIRAADALDLTNYAVRYDGPLKDLISRLKMVSITGCVLSVCVLPALVFLKHGDLPNARQATLGTVATLGAVGSTAALQFVFGSYVLELQSVYLPTTITSNDENSNADPKASNINNNDTNRLIFEATTRSVFGFWTTTHRFDPLNKTDVQPYTNGVRPFANFTAKGIPLYVHPNLLDRTTRTLLQIPALPTMASDGDDDEDDDENEEEEYDTGKREVNEGLGRSGDVTTKGTNTKNKQKQKQQQQQQKHDDDDDWF